MQRTKYKILEFSFILFLIYGMGHNVTFGQAKLPMEFEHLIHQVELDIAVPVEGTFRERNVRRNEFFTADYIIRSRKQKVEIQYAVVNTLKHPRLVPQVHTMTVVSNLARNEDAFSTIAIHDIENQELKGDYNADWGAVAYFQPKRSISRYKHAKLLSLFKAGKAMVYVLVLFNEGNEQLANALSRGAKFN